MRRNRSIKTALIVAAGLFAAGSAASAGGLDPMDRDLVRQAAAGADRPLMVWGGAASSVQAEHAQRGDPRSPLSAPAAELASDHEADRFPERPVASQVDRAPLATVDPEVGAERR